MSSSISSILFKLVKVKEFVSLFEENRRTLVLRFSKSEIQISGSGTSIEQMEEIWIIVVVVWAYLPIFFVKTLFHPDDILHHP